MNGGSSLRRAGFAGVAVLMVVGLAVAWLTLKSPAQPQAVEASDQAPSEPAPTATAAAALSAEDQAHADLDALVRQYYAAENEIYLDPHVDPSAPLEPFLNNPALAARIADIMMFRNAGHVQQSGSVVVHSVDVVALDLAAEMPTASLVACRTMTATGIDGATGEPATYDDHGAIDWTATRLPDMSWRLDRYQGRPDGPC